MAHKFTNSSTLLGIAIALKAAATAILTFLASFEDADAVSPAQIVQEAGNDTSTGEPEDTVDDSTLDKNGLPHCTLIHDKNKVLTKGGEWTAKRKVDPDFRAARIAELRKTYPEPQAATPVTPQITVPSVNVPTPQITVPLTPYQQLVDWLTRNAGPGKTLTPEFVQQTFAGAGVTGGVADLATQPAETSTAWLNAFKQALAAAGVAEA